MSTRYEINTRYFGIRRKKFHVWDKLKSRVVFHTTNRDKAERLIAIACDRDIDQHMKDGHDHNYESANPDNFGPCKICNKR